MPSEHAKLSASGAKRWLECPRSVALESLFPETDTVFTREGTEAHALAEKALLAFIREGKRDMGPEAIGGDPAMAEPVSDYLSDVMAIHDSLELKHGEAMLFPEQRVSFGEFVPEGFGTCDAMIASGDELHVIDLKFGKGVKVECKGNPQPRLYALGAIRHLGWLYSFKTVTTHIIQPRLRWADEETMTASDLISWGRDYVLPRAKLAFSDKGEFNPGEWCRFCKAKAVCRAKAQSCLGVIQSILEGRKR